MELDRIQLSVDSFSSHERRNHVAEVLRHLHSVDDSRKCVTIIGAGRVGSWTALKLAQRGVKRFILIDNDVVEESNIETEWMMPYTFFQLGDYKVNALKKMIEQKSKANIITFNKRITSSLSQPELIKMFLDSVLIVWAIDSVDGLEVTQNAELMNSRVSVLPAMHANIGGGRVIAWIPYLTPCPKHSLHLGNFKALLEARARDSKITSNDVKIVSDCTADMVTALLFKRFNTRPYLNILDRGNYLHIEKLDDERYRRIWINQQKGQNCELCSPTYLMETL